MNASSVRALALAAMLTSLWSTPVLAAAPVPAAVIVPQKITLLDVVAVGKSFIAVGERGVVARSEDAGTTWTGRLTPSTRTLTSVAFVNDQVGVAVGHGGTVLRTEDAGATWASVAVPEINKDAVLGVTALKSGQLVACGAFGMYIVSDDKGKTWRREQVIAADFERHISKVIETRQGLMLVGETGVIARWDDAGKRWAVLTSPYAGSYFGLLELRSGALLAYGMRGNVYRSKDQGATWEKMPLDSKSTLNGGSVAADGSIVLSGNNGLIAVSTDEGQSFTLLKASEGTSIAQSLMLENRDLVYVGHMAASHHVGATKTAAATPVEK